MTDPKKRFRDSSSLQSGNAIVIVLVILVIVAVGVLAFMSGKMQMLKENMSGNEVAATASDSAATQTLQNSNPVLAILNGEEIKRLEVLELIKAMPPQMQQIPFEQLFPMALEQIISNKIIDIHAVDAGLENDEDVKKQIEQARIQAVRTKFLENEIKDKLTEERVKAKYEEYKENFPDVEEIKVAHILVDDETIAKDLIKKLNKGVNFAELAKANSKDGSSENGGDLGYFVQSEVVPEFADAAFATPPGEYTKSPVKSDFGYHIIKVDDKRKRSPAEYAQVKTYLEKELQRTIFDEMLKGLKKNVKIERFDINGNPIPSEQEPAAGEEAAKTEPQAGGDENVVEEAMPETGNTEADESEAVKVE